MERIYNRVTELVGNTPLLRLNSIEKHFGLKCRLLAKLEYLNPAGSAKDRVALEMIEQAEKDGLLKPGATIIEPTSGNTGIALAAIATVKGYRCIIVIPDTMSVERRNIIKAYGAEVVLSDGKLGMQGSIDKAEELQREIPGSFIPAQFDNPANVDAHYKTTGPEIWRDTDGNVDIFVAGIGTGGTITGTGRYLKEQNPEIQIIGMEPASSPFLSEGRAGAHGIQGIGAGFVPSILDQDIYDEIVTVEDDEAIEFGKLIATKEGFLVGISSGAALSAAVEVAKRPESEGKTIVVLLPDSGDRYYSTKLFQ
ncbi:MAG: cysteine synthase A [Agathobacter sp.]|nr:cysteine synthase A [Agathobacter sp.]